MEATTAIVQSGTPSAAARRCFRLFDAIILVAATALGLAAVQWIARETDGEISWQVLFDESWGVLDMCLRRDWAAVGVQAHEVGLLIAWLTASRLPECGRSL